MTTSLDALVFSVLGDKRARIVRAAALLKQGPVSVDALLSCGLSERMSNDIMRAVKASGAEQVDACSWRLVAPASGLKAREIERAYSRAAEERGLTLHPSVTASMHEHYSGIEAGQEQVERAAMQFLSSDYWQERGYPFSAFVRNLREYLDQSEAVRAGTDKRTQERVNRTLAALRLQHINRHGASSWTKEAERALRNYAERLEKQRKDK